MVTMSEKRYTLDAMKDGKHFEDHNLTEQEINNAKSNAERLGITNLRITEETPIDPKAMHAFYRPWA